MNEEALIEQISNQHNELMDIISRTPEEQTNVTFALVRDDSNHKADSGSAPQFLVFF